MADFDASQVRAATRKAKHGPQARRLARLDATARGKGVGLGQAPWFDLAHLEAWFGDEACIGQKNRLTRRWANTSGIMARSWNTAAQKAESMNSKILTRVTGTPTCAAAPDRRART